MMSTGLPPKSPAPPQQDTTSITFIPTPGFRKHGVTPSSWLNLEGPAATDIQRGNPSHRRSTSDSFTQLRQSDFSAINGDYGGRINLVDANKTSDGDISNMIVNENSSPPMYDSSNKTETDEQVDARGRKFDPNMDHKRIKRIMANRLSAQKSRMKKLEYKAELERSANALEAEVSLLSSQVSHFDRKRLFLRMENNFMKQKMAQIMSEKLFREAEFHAWKEEAERLKQLYRLQQEQKLQAGFDGAERKQQQQQPQPQQEQQNPNMNNINMVFLKLI